MTKRSERRARATRNASGPAWVLVHRMARLLWCALPLTFGTTKGAAASPVGALTQSSQASPDTEAHAFAMVQGSDLKGLAPADLGALDILGRAARGEGGRGSLLVRAPRALLANFLEWGHAFKPLAEPWTTMQGVDGYLEPQDVVSGLGAFAQALPRWMRLETIGKTHAGRPIVALVIDDGANNPERSDASASARPTVFFDGMHHAREVMTTEVVFDIAKAFAEALGGTKPDAELLEWAHKYRIVLAPQLNPDGNALVHAGQRFWRKNAWPLNGKTVGVDLNRNYPSYWGACSGSSGQTSSDTYRGPSAASEPETQALMQAVERFRPSVAISYHSFSELIIFPYGCSNVTNPSRTLFASLAGAMNQSIKSDRGTTGSYDVGTAPELLYNADGSDLDWQWDNYGVYAFTIEINSSLRGFQPEYEAWRNQTVQNQSGGWRALIRQMDGPGVSGRFELFESAGDATAWKEYTYTLEWQAPDQAGTQAAWQPFAIQDGTKHFPLRDATGSFFQILLPGTYRMRFWTRDERLAERTFSVGSSHVALGVVTQK